MKRRRRGSDDSLGLLLDAICNTFGVVLLIAIVIAIMVQTSSPPTPAGGDKDDEKKHKLQQQLVSVQSTVDTLEHAHAQASVLNQAIADPDVAGLVADRKDLREEEQKVAEELDRLEREIESTRADSAESDSKAENVHATRAELEEEVAATRRELQLESRRQTNVRSADLPQLKDNNNAFPVVLILRYGRLYTWHRFSSSGKRMGLNTDDFLVTKESADFVQTEPKPWAGIDLRAAGWEQSLRFFFAKFNRNRYRVSFVVYQDSYPEFQLAKGFVVGRGYSYIIRPMSSNVSLLDRGGKDSQSQ